MRTIWQSLVWKEWQEHKWKFVSLVAVFCGVVTIVLMHIPYLPEQDLFEAAYATTAFVVLPLAIFVGAGVAAGERSRGTAAFLQAMPVAPWKVAAFKLAAGLLTLVVAIALAFGFIWGWQVAARSFGIEVPTLISASRQWMPSAIDFGNWFVNRGVLVSLIAGSLYLWTAAFGVNRQDEVSAAARGTLAVVVWWCLLLAAIRWLDTRWLMGNGEWLALLYLSASPAGILGVDPSAAYDPRNLLMGISWPVMIGLLAQLYLVYWYASRFDGMEGGPVRSPQASRSGRKLDWEGRPRRSRFAAVAWKQVRESGPLVTIGLAAVLAIFAVSVIVGGREVDAATGLEIYAAVTASVGLMIALVAGIGVAFFDVGTPLNSFWRSRPIDPNLWYWTKISIGLLLVVGSLYLPLLIAIWMVSGMDFFRGAAFYEAATLPAITIGLFISAVTMTCLIRQPIYAAIFGIGAMLAGPFLVQIAWMAGHRLYGPKFDEVLPLQQYPGAIVTSIVAAIVISLLFVGWGAMRNDWGRRDRY